jgi:uncharacterized delta-60 repeat protein
MLKHILHFLLLLITCHIAAQNGTLDLSFGHNGSVTTGSDLNGSFGLNVALQPDGKILTVTSIKYDIHTQKMGVYRYLPNGDLDQTFGQGGLALVDTQLLHISTGTNLCLQPDGKILVLGIAIASVGASEEYAVARLLPNGKMDTSFGNKGVAIVKFWDYDSMSTLFGLKLQPDGKILLAGSKADSSYTVIYATLLRLLPNGEKDTEFANNGLFTYAGIQGSISFFYKIELMSEGKIVVLGITADSVPRLLMVQLLPDGTLNPGFGNNGVVQDDFGDHASACSFAIQEDQKIVVNGSFPTDNNIARYMPDGKLDTTFAHIGWAKYDCWPFRCDCGAIAVQKDGKIVIGVNQFTSNGYDHCVLRVLPDGTPDPTFGKAGWVFTELGEFKDESIVDIVIQPDHKILLAGHQRQLNSSFRTLLVRYNGNHDPFVNPDSIDTFFKLYPNPTSGPLVLEYAISKQSDVKVEVYDMLGRFMGNILEIKGKEKGIYQETIGLDEWLPAGVYVIHFVTNEQNIYLQFVKVVVD